MTLQLLIADLAMRFQWRLFHPRRPLEMGLEPGTRLVLRGNPNVEAVVSDQTILIGGRIHYHLEIAGVRWNPGWISAHGIRIAFKAETSRRVSAR